MLRRLCLILFVVLFVQVLPVAAHANLLRSEPPANTRLETSPEQLLLYFSEPLEANFSRIELHNAQNEIIETSPAVLSDADDTVLSLDLDALPDGVYTVAWRVVSQTDGHMTQGSYPIIIGMANSSGERASTTFDDAIPVSSSVIRWFNLLSLAFLIGSVGFGVFVWQKNMSEQYPNIERQMRAIILLGWISAGVASGLILLLQSQIVSGAHWLAAIGFIPQVLSGTRFGTLWLIRISLWLVFGILFWKQIGSQPMLLVIGAGILITQSLFSHASGTLDASSAIIADVLHLMAMSLWVGGLIQLLFVIVPMRKNPNDLAILVAHFSNMARLSVVILVITGVYAAWLHIGSLDALISTPYGKTMIVKLVLFLPLLMIGAINLLLTSRGLKHGKIVWSQRLRFLVGTEILLALAIIGAVGVMTAIAPARTTVAARESVDATPQTNPFFEMAIEDEMMIHLTIDPASVGENMFYVDLYDENSNEIIDNASLIRLRFENESDNLGESELRPELQADGRYMVQGANLSVAGDWQIRMTIQRPNEFDTVLDFEPSISMSEQPVIPDFDPNPSQDDRGLALALTGLVGLIAGSIFLILQRPFRVNAPMVFTVFFILGSLVILVNGGRLLMPKIAVRSVAIADDQAIQMSISADSAYPVLLTQDGAVLRHDGDAWSRLAIDGVHIQGIYQENANRIWAATDQGLYSLEGDEWEQHGDFPAENLAITHGYVYAMGTGGILRFGQGGIENDVRMLDIPEPDSTANDFVMLGNHSHVLLDGTDVFLTSSLGLGWQAIDAPEDVRAVAIDANGNLLAVTDTDLMRWRWSNETWQQMRDLLAMEQ